MFVLRGPKDYKEVLVQIMALCWTGVDLIEYLKPYDIIRPQ